MPSLTWFIWLAQPRSVTAAKANAMNRNAAIPYLHPLSF
jgi:hypothetical protein